MIRGFVGFGLVLIAVADLASGQDNVKKAAPTDEALRITISCDDGKACVANRDYLRGWPKKIVVVSSETWDCRIVAGSAGQLSIWDAKASAPQGEVCAGPRNLPAASEAVLYLRSTKNGAHFVGLPVFDAKRSQPRANLPIVSLGTTLMALLMATWVVYLSRNSAAAGEHQAAALATSITVLETGIRSIVETLRFPEPAGPPPLGPDPVPKAREVETLRAEIGQFVQSVRDCFVGLGKVPDEAGNKTRELERLLSQVGRQTDAATARAQYQAMAKTLARLAVSAADDDFNRQRRRNLTAEASLKSLLDVAGFSLLVPKPLDKYTEAWHILSGQTERTEHRSHQGYVARVERRGLLDSNNEVIEKAEVVLYDYRPQ